VAKLHQSSQISVVNLKKNSEALPRLRFWYGPTLGLLRSHSTTRTLKPLALNLLWTMSSAWGIRKKVR